jgi:hypothetical protein
MTPQEKAKELYHKFQVYEVNGQKRMQYGPQVKVFTLVALEELLLCSLDYDKAPNWASQVRYWQDVKKEIEKL